MTLPPGYGVTSFQLIDYRPYCGLLDATMGDGPWTVGPQCTSAMAQYRNTTDTYGLYLCQGETETPFVPVESGATTLGRGMAFCLCFSLGDIKGLQSDICLFVPPDGSTPEQEVWNARYPLGAYARGTKALPKCYEELATVVSAV